ncbi:MAG TPA: helix-turn-helix domain-containing protein [Fimbriimonadaceae bacterium]|nr:helix-turn-helix domain-containing protein [Fimbriimonadaceae bacterium]
MTTAFAQRDREVGERIRQAAEQVGMSVRELGQRIGVSRPTIYAYIAGRLAASPQRLQKIAEVTGRPLEFFVGAVRDTRILAQPITAMVDALLSQPDRTRACMLALEGAAAFDAEGAHASAAALEHQAGNVLVLEGDYLEAITHLTSARSSYLRVGMREEAASCSQSLGYAYINVGKIERAEACFDEALRDLPPERRWIGEVSMAALDERVGNFDGAEARLDALLKRNGLSDAGRAFVLFNQASLSGTRGFFELCYERNLRALPQARALRAYDQIAERHIQLARATLKMGRLEEASLWLVRGFEAIDISGDNARRVLAQIVLSRLLMVCGDLPAARKTAVRALGDATQHEYRRSQAMTLELLAEIAFARHDLDQAQDYAIQAATFGDKNTYPVTAFTSRIIGAFAAIKAGERSAPIETTMDVATLGFPRALAMSLRALEKSMANEPLLAVEASDEAIRLAEVTGAKLLAMAEAIRWQEYRKQAGLAPDRTMEQTCGTCRQTIESQRPHIPQEDGLETRAITPKINGGGIAHP